MLRERSRLQHQKDQQIMGHLISDTDSESCCHQYDVLGHKNKTNSVLNAPGVFVGFNPKASESDSVRSPTSPLDFRLFSNLANPFRSPRLASKPEGHHKSWNCNKVGLRIIDSLDDDAPHSGKILRSSDGRNILVAPHGSTRMPNFQTRIDSSGAPKSLPKNYELFDRPRIKPSNLQMGDSDGLFGIRETPFEPEPFERVLSCSLDSARSWSLVATSTNHSSSTNSSSGNFGPGNGRNPENSSATKLNPESISIGSAQCFTGSLSASEIELSEDYTCVKTYGPNPKTTHIFGDCILECNDSTITDSPNKQKTAAECPAFYPAGDFMSCCYSCKKKLEGEDIYIYRGEKAFCSGSCRSQEILMEEEKKKAMDVSSSPRNSDEEKSESSSMFFVT